MNVVQQDVTGLFGGDLLLKTVAMQKLATI